MKPLINFKEKLMENFILKSEEFVIEFKAKLVKDMIFEIP